MSAYSDAILAESALQSYWKLDEASGSPADSKASLSGTTSGTLTYGQTGYGSTGNAILSNGASPTRITFGDNYRFSGTSAFTLECWLKLNGDTGGRFMSKYDESFGNGYHFAVGGNKLYGQRHNGTTSTDVTGATTLTDGVWYHVALTYDGSNLRLYVNGVLDATAASTNSIGSPTSKPFTIFATADTSQTAANYYLGAYMSHVAVYNAALSASSLLAHFQAGVNLVNRTAGDTWAWSETTALSKSGGTVLQPARYAYETWAWSDSTTQPTRSRGSLRTVWTAGTTGTFGAHYAFASVVRTNDSGGLLAVARKATTHGSYDGSLVGKISTDDGVTWGSEFTIVNGSTTGYDERDPKMVRLASGRIVMTWGRRKLDAGTYYIGTQPQFMYSDDGGVTWSSPVTVTTNLYVATAGSNKSGLVYGSDIVELSNGDLLLFGYGTHDNTNFNAFDLFISKSTDGGATWAHLTNPAVKSTYGYNCVEPQVVLEDNGTLYMVFHLEDGVPSTVKIAKSTDNGATWSVSSWVTTAENREGLATTLSGVGLAMAYQVTADGFYYRESLDRGRTYGSAKLIDTFSSLGYTQGLWTMPITLAGAGLSQNLGIIYGVEQSGQVQASTYYRQFSGLDGIFISLRNAGDTWAWSDSAARGALTGARTAGDTWAWSDSAARSSARSRTAGDTWGWADTSTGTRGAAKTASDTWAWSDTPTRSLVHSYTRSIGDTWAWSDASTGTAGLTGAAVRLPATANFVSARSQTANFVSAKSQTADFVAGAT